MIVRVDSTSGDKVGQAHEETEAIMAEQTLTTKRYPNNGVTNKKINQMQQQPSCASVLGYARENERLSRAVTKATESVKS